MSTYTRYIRTVYENFNQCLFAGLILWALFTYPIMNLFFEKQISVLLYGISPFLNGIFCLIFMRYWLSFLKRITKKRGATIRESFGIGSVAFIAGFICIFTAFQPIAFLLGGIIGIFTILKIKSFIRRITLFLPPHHYISHYELLLFISFFIDLIIFFTLLNLTFGIIDNPVILASEDILNETLPVVRSDNLFNALYFTVITLTTVGFGDFIPLSYFGKMIVVLECLTSYVMFGLMIGLMARGVRPNKTIRRTAFQNALNHRTRKS